MKPIEGKQWLVRTNQDCYCFSFISIRTFSFLDAIGVSNLVEFLNVKTADQLCIILGAISELLRRVPTENENIPLLFGARHCIPPMVRILNMDYDQKLLLTCLSCIQQLCLLPTFRPCRRNQTIFQKANGFNQILTLIRRSNKDKLVQAKAITTLATIIFGIIILVDRSALIFGFILDHKENKESLGISVIKQIFKRIGSLLNSTDENVRIEAGAGYEKSFMEYHLIYKSFFRLVTFICNDVNYYNACSESLSLTPDHFRILLSSETISVRCQAAFQVNIYFLHFETISIFDF